MSDVQTSGTEGTPVDTSDSASAEVTAQPIKGGELNPEGYEAMKAEAKEDDGTTEVEIRDQTFKVVANLPGIVLLDLGVASDPSATQGEQLRALREFLKSAIAPEDLGRFEHFLRTAQPTIYIDELNKIVEKLLAVIGGRPTE